MQSNCTIKICNLYKSFGSKLILNNISFEFEKNRMYGIVGESGTGKTTLLNILGLIDNKYSGEIFFNGEKLKPNKDYHNIRAEQIGFIFQSYYLIDELTVKENILLPLKYSKKEVEDEYFNFLIKKLKIEDLLDEKTNYLSGGEKQRVSIARALINNPSLIICDEPTGNLDCSNAESVLEILKSFIDDHRTIIIVTHSQEVANHCSTLITLEKGGLYEIKK